MKNNVVDSSGWLEYFANGPNADFFAPPIENSRELVVPTLSILEVFKRVHQQRDEDHALQAVVLMQQGQVVVLDGGGCRRRSRWRWRLLVLATTRANSAGRLCGLVA